MCNALWGAFSLGMTHLLEIFLLCCNKYFSLLLLFSVFRVCLVHLDQKAWVAPRLFAWSIIKYYRLFLPFIILVWIVKILKQLWLFPTGRRWSTWPFWDNGTCWQNSKCGQHVLKRCRDFCHLCCLIVLFYCWTTGWARRTRGAGTNWTYRWTCEWFCLLGCLSFVRMLI